MATVVTDVDNIQVKSFILRPESWNVFAFAETYICFQLEKLSGAHVYIPKDSERDQGTKREIKAEGTTAQLNQLGNSLSKIESKSLRCSKHGHFSIVGSLSIFFEGSQGDEDNVEFGEYDDICQTKHENRNKFIPYLSQPNLTPAGTDLYAFQSKFLSQWQKVRDEYDPLFHGDMCLVLTYGYSYFMNLSDEVLSIRHLNEHLEVFHDKFEEFLSKIEKGKYAYPVPYWHSFMANSGHSNGFKEFLNSAFDKIRTERKVKVGINKLGMCELDNNFCVHQLNVPKIEWFDGRIIRKTESACPKHKLSVTCKLISYRDVHLRDLQRAEEFRTIIKHDGTAKICQKRGEEIIVNSEAVTFIREKETDIYSAPSLDIQNHKIKRPIRVEVSKVREQEVSPKNRTCAERPERQEMAVISNIPELGASDHEIKCYLKDIWNTALFFGDMLDR